MFSPKVLFIVSCITGNNAVERNNVVRNIVRLSEGFRLSTGKTKEMVVDYYTARAKEYC